jgi:Holliday junction resolvase
VATPESKVKAAVVKMFKQHGVYYFFPATFGYGKSGVPDIVGCIHSHFVAVECKAGRGVLTALQERELAQIDAAGGFTFIARENNLDELKEKLLCLIQKLSPNA